MSYIPSTDVCIQVLEIFVFIVELIIYHDTNRKMKLNDFTRRNVRFEHIFCSYGQFLEIITLFLIYTFVCVYCKIGPETNRKQKKRTVFILFILHLLFPFQKQGHLFVSNIWISLIFQLNNFSVNCQRFLQNYLFLLKIILFSIRIFLFYEVSNIKNNGVCKTCFTVLKGRFYFEDATSN